ncbi:hypothetical protein A2334_06195 [Candidatus Roizmanbacteria bacterium RIFOXYB2_FULL_38_10]|uniref:Glutamyl-tRNA amidotransferase n=1 Tax=Candidatus Roizmanbacteria bacterium RIFOXYD1_FULL_38_12 TaxID=1802093 RepID=A0A1F7L275_9BACT|nr:MAG: hypothetical protein A3K47_05195 [Candidatus Roizmanbacteria bacterium RIFOXYA2_FULL_38_14]OGK64141.1 MAG: hypothetical protein A3K27_05195 [Candidatus Roizmanbacteria bacterium RIFOXYA1_FULL_37_12]OGK65987.1 MAG: hypothetical protein A3K38_05195 [Candidatus Roizmanbacteria bacterium RIFOXYB1_FULL_40_23]OGK68434.1 MAG: hypothetical protein A2334_06195 [Candidatus Roizmanbacteria bacterium RIFOXYB2_FULL_38_10]OGK70392.1 MAG: hypothetical protein A3K21_05200 [Candidatus Roizmanbacteria ba
MIKQKLQADQLTAQKAKDQIKLDTIRYIVSQVKNKEIALQRELTDEEAISVLQKIKKELNESIQSFAQGKRLDLVTEYQKQLAIVLTYLPLELTDEELKKEVETVVEKNKDLYATSPKALIGICIKELKTKADSSRIIKTLQNMKRE